MHLDATPMRLAHHKCQRVVERFGCHALAASEIARPRLQIGLIKGIGGGAHLKKNSVEIQGLQRIEQRHHALFLRPHIGGRWRPIDAHHCGNPRRTHLAFALRKQWHSQQQTARKAGETQGANRS